MLSIKNSISQSVQVFLKTGGPSFDSYWQELNC